MLNSKSNQPDLDWSQVKETVKVLTVSVVQVESSMKEGDNSVNTLTQSFTSLVSHMNAINEILESMEGSENSQEAMTVCLEARAIIQASIVAFQFYDRLQQSLSHVAESLRGLSDLVEDPTRIYNPLEWEQLRGFVRSQYTMESEKAIFDAIIQGKSIDEAVLLANQVKETDDNDDIELF